MSPAADIAGWFDGSTKANVARVEAHPETLAAMGQTAAVAMLASGAGEIVDGLGLAAKTGLAAVKDLAGDGIGRLLESGKPLIAHALGPEEDPDVFDTARWAAARAFKAAVEQHAGTDTDEAIVEVMNAHEHMERAFEVASQEGIGPDWVSLRMVQEAYRNVQVAGNSLLRGTFSGRGYPR